MSNDVTVDDEQVKRFAFELCRTYMLIGNVPAAAEVDDDEYLEAVVADPLLPARLVGFFQVMTSVLAKSLAEHQLRAAGHDPTEVEVRDAAIRALSMWVSDPPASPQ